MDKRRDGAVKIQDTEMYYVSFGKGMILSAPKCDRVPGTLSHLCKTCEIWYNRDADAAASSLIF